MKRLTLEFGSRHVVAVGGFETPNRFCSESMDPARILSLSLSLHLFCLITHSLSQNEEINIKKEKERQKNNNSNENKQTNKQTNKDRKPEESCLLVPGTGGCAGLEQGLSGPISVSLTPIEKQLRGTECQGLV